MVFWVAVIVGGTFAYMGIKKGLFMTWAVLFNVLVSIYIGVMLTPVIIKIIISGSGSNEYHYYNCAGSLAIVSAIIFVLLQTIVINLVIETFQVTLPKVFSRIFSGILGFLAGYLVCGFVFFAVSVAVTPLKRPLIEGLVNHCRFGENSVKKACSFVALASLQCYDDGPKVVDWIVKPNYDSDTNVYDNSEIHNVNNAVDVDE